MSVHVLCMSDTSTFHTFRQHAEFEVFARAWHPLIPLLGQLSRHWRKEMQAYWRKNLVAVERCDITARLYPKSSLSASLEISVGFYRCLHGTIDDYVNGKYGEYDSLNAVTTCFLYNWPEAAMLICQHCRLAEIGVSAERDKRQAACASACIRMATAKRSMELTEVACSLFQVPKEDVQWALSQMCAYGYKGIACYIVEQFSCNIDDLRARDN